MEKVIPGNTKLVELKNIEKRYNLKTRLFAKVENSNPSGSIKDRPVYQMLLDYKNDGILKEDSVVVEATSGNTGISLAFYSKIFNYKLLIFMPKSMSKERREMIASLGGELVLVDGGMKQAEEAAIEEVRTNPKAFIFDQFNNKNNVKAHILTTGPEIYHDLHTVKYIFAGIGTGGTASGIATYFSQTNKDVKIIGVEPYESPLLTKHVAGAHLIQGIGANFVPSILRLDLIKEIEDVKGLEAIEMAKEIRNIEHIDIGISSGAALKGALNYIKRNNIHDEDVVIIFPDKGDRYQW